MLSIVFTRPNRWRFFWKHTFLEIDQIGINSLPIVALMSTFMGAVIALQTASSMESPLLPDYTVGFITQSSTILEFSPTIISLILAGKVGSNVASEIGTMRVTEQIDAMQVSDNNPFKYLVVTRVVAATLMLPILVILADGFGLVGSLVGVNIKGDVSAYLFFSQIFQSLEFADLIPAIIKTFFFGYFIGLIGCYKGYNSNKGTEGVGEAANSAVVLSSLMVFIIDMIAVQITSVLQN